ncbi:MAG: DegT/DnrJ/EryC1/StrS family aminotransferase [Burkholderiales bacterium]|nr:DegT/DnrJ/EryC1/StrS family aminotransferase [Burkholderiales bacterium]
MIRTDYLPFGKPNFSDQEVEAVSRVLRSGWVGMGPETIAFENELGQAVGAPHVVSVNSCTSALFLALLAEGVGPGDEVVCPSLTWCSTANAALYLGATPVFADIEEDTLCATPDRLLAAVTPRTRAVVPVHFGGLAIDVAELRRKLPPHVAIVEDAAHALGARYRDGTPVGSSGNAVCFSFYANKNLSTGEGGAIALADTGKANRLRSLRLHALPLDAWKRFSDPRSLLLSNLIDELGYKMNYTDLNAAIGRVQLRRQPEFAAARRVVAERYARVLCETAPDIRLQRDCTGPAHARHLFVIQLPIERLARTRDEIVRGLRERNVGASIHYTPLHVMPLYADCPQGQLPVTERVAARILTLPISASMTVGDADYVLEQLLEVLQ